MGFNKRIVNSKQTILALETNGLKSFYGKSDMLLFEDSLSSDAYTHFLNGKTDEEILLIIKNNMEEKTDEMY